LHNGKKLLPVKDLRQVHSVITNFVFGPSTGFNTPFVPVLKVPKILEDSISLSQTFQFGTSAQSLQICSFVAVVLRLTSVVYILN
jgi:hypothetical protein